MPCVFHSWALFSVFLYLSAPLRELRTIDIVSPFFLGTTPLPGPLSGMLLLQRPPGHWASIGGPSTALGKAMEVLTGVPQLRFFSGGTRMSTAGWRSSVQRGMPVKAWGQSFFFQPKLSDLLRPGTECSAGS